MKRVFYVSMFALALGSCTNDFSEDATLFQKEVVNVSLPNVDSRTIMDGNSVKWESADHIGIFKTSGSNYANNDFVLKTGANTTSATFEAEKTTGETNALAYYPYNANASYNGTSLTLPLESEYAYGATTHAVMAAELSNGSATNIAFKNAGTLVAITVKNIPQGYTHAVMTAAEKIAGNATVTFSNGTPTLAIANDASSTSISIDFTENADVSKTFYFPVPVGEYSQGLKITLTGDQQEEKVVGTLKNSNTDATFSAKRNEIHRHTVTYNDQASGGIEEVVADAATLKEKLAEGAAITLGDEVTELSASDLSVPAGVSSVLDLNGKTLKLDATSTTALARSTSATHGISNYGTLTINGGKIVFTSENINKAAIYNEGNITLTDVEIETNARCFANHGPWTMGQDLAAHGTNPSVVATITDCIFKSTLSEHLTAGRHIYAVHGEFYSKITMKNTTINGHGGISVDCSYAELENVTATHICTTGAHDLYVPCGNAIVTNCTFENAAAYSDDTYGKAVVNGVTYQNGTTAIQTWSEIDTPEELAAAFTNGGSYKLTASIEVTEALTATKPIALLMGDDVEFIIKNNEILFGLTNKSNMTIKGGAINFTGNTTKNGAAVYNVGQIQLEDVDITSNNGCFINDGDATKKTLEGLKAEDATVTAVINGGIFNSSFCKSGSHTQHRYAVTGFWYSNLIMNGTTIEGSGGVCADVSFATLTNVNAEHACQYGAHDLYVPCGNATVTNCTFTNAAAYSDTTYGIAVVNGTPYNIPEGKTYVTTPIVLN